MDPITLKPQPSADLTNNSTSSPAHKVQHRVSANCKQHGFHSLPFNSTFDCDSKTTPRSHADTEEDQGTGHSQHACQPPALALARLPTTTAPAAQIREGFPTLEASQPGQASM